MTFSTFPSVSIDRRVPIAFFLFLFFLRRTLKVLKLLFFMFGGLEGPTRLQQQERHRSRSNMHEQRETAGSTHENGCWCFYGDTKMRSVLQRLDRASIAQYTMKERGDSSFLNSFILSSFSQMFSGHVSACNV